MPSRSTVRTHRGFTLIEVLVVMGIISILAAIVIIAINPSRQFKQAHDTQRAANVVALANAIGQNIADHKGVFTCDEELPETATLIAKSGGVDLRDCLVPLYLPELPYDPVTGANTCDGETCDGTGEDYATGYTVMQDESTDRITIAAPDTEIADEDISITR